MTGPRDRMPAVEIQISLAIARVDPDALTTFCDDRHLLVSRELITLLA
jgi:hypothetical protein